MKKLNILELHRTINDMKHKHYESFDRIVESCHKKIVASTNKQQLNCFYEVPQFVIGYPIFDLTKCIEYLKKTLEGEGFLVKYYFPKYLYISWDFEEMKQNKTNKTNEEKRPDIKIDNTNILSYKPSGKFQLNLF